MLKKIRDKLDLHKPHALGWNEWTKWHETTRKERPWAYFIAETVPEFLRDSCKRITDPINSARSWVRYRVFDRMHVVNTGLAPGYHDSDERMLHGMFSLLVDYVEVELAWMHVVFDKTAREHYRHPWWSLGWTRFKSFRDPRAGLDHLRWEMSLDDEKLPSHERNPHQAVRAREIWQLYHWWKNIRPKRPDPHDASGWSEYCRKHTLDDILDDDVSDDDRLVRMEIIDLSREIETSYDEEDEQMLIRLVKIRKSLWT